MNDIIEHYFNVVNNSEKRKIFVTVGHDSTIANLMMALNVWEVQVPEYNAMVILELHKIKNDFAVKVRKLSIIWYMVEYKKNYYFLLEQIIYKNSTNDVYHLKIPNCSIACPLLKFVDLMKDVTSKDIENDCSSATWKLKTKELGSP